MKVLSLLLVFLIANFGVTSDDQYSTNNNWEAEVHFGEFLERLDMAVYNEDKLELAKLIDDHKNVYLGDVITDLKGSYDRILDAGFHNYPDAIYGTAFYKFIHNEKPNKNVYFEIKKDVGKDFYVAKKLEITVTNRTEFP